MMKNKIRTITLAGSDYKILYYDFTTTVIQELGQMAGGYFDNTKQEIHINTDDTTDQCQINTLIHEILHLIYAEYNIKDDWEEEEIIESMTNGLMGIFKSKPQLLETIKKNL